MAIALEQSPTEKTMKVPRKSTGRDLEEVALEMGLKMMEGQKDLNDLPGSWADDPNFEDQVLDFTDV
jgi:hypothetical protein